MAGSGHHSQTMGGPHGGDGLLVEGQNVAIFPPTISSVGQRTWGRVSNARSGLPPLLTTAWMALGRAAAWCA